MTAQRIIIYIIIIAEALVTLDVHGKDTLAGLCKDHVVKNTDFKWLCHLRYYWLVTINYFSKLKHDLSTIIFWRLY